MACAARVWLCSKQTLQCKFTTALATHLEPTWWHAVFTSLHAVFLALHLTPASALNLCRWETLPCPNQGCEQRFRWCRLKAASSHITHSALPNSSFGDLGLCSSSGPAHSVFSMLRNKPNRLQLHRLSQIVWCRLPSAGDDSAPAV